MEKVLFEGEWKETFNAGLAVRQEKILEQLKKVAPIIWDREEKEGRGLALSADREGRISYAQSKTSFDDDNRRATTTLQRYVRRQLKLNTSELADHKLNSVCQEALKPFTYTKLEAVSGTAIAQAYHEGFGNTSCMTGGSISSIKQLLSLYVENPEKIQLAKYYYGSSQARALIWHVAEGEIFIDRIYSNIVNIREDFISEIKNLYKDKTVHLREHNNLPCGEETFKSFCFDLNEPSSGEYPFLDTFRYANESTAINTIGVGWGLLRFRAL